MEDKRRTKRIKKSLVVRYSYENDRGERVWDTSVVKDISEGGMSITTLRHFPVHKILTFLIRIPTKPFEDIELQGKVCASKEYGAGTYVTHIEFIDLKDEEKRLLQEYVNWFLKEESNEAQTYGA